MLLALIWKSSYYPAVDDVYRSIPLDDEFFPDWLESIWTLRITMIGSIVGWLVWRVRRLHAETAAAEAVPLPGERDL